MAKEINQPMLGNSLTDPSTSGITRTIRKLRLEMAALEKAGKVEPVAVAGVEASLRDLESSIGEKTKR